MNNYLDLANKVDRSRLKEDDYFRTLVDEGTKAGILSEFDVEYIQVSLLEVLSEVCMSVTEKGNSSMRTEAAEEIAKSVIYTFSVAMKEYESPETALEKLKNEPFFPDAPCVFVGDMNAEPDSPEMLHVLENSNMVDFATNLGGTYHGFHTVEPVKIDYIYADPRIRCTNVYKWTDNENGVFLSDHYPVCAEIELL